MIEIGRMHTLEVDRIDRDGVWLHGGQRLVMLPREEASVGVRPGNRLPVFIYGETDGVLLGTLKRPRALLGEFALLTVTNVARPGAFLDWGLDKDLLVPFQKQPDAMEPGLAYLVKVCLDKQGRLFGNAQIDSLLEMEATDELKVGQKVSVILWQFTELGAKVIVNHRFAGLLYRDELSGRARVGDSFSGYIKHIREDRRLDVTLRPLGVEAVEAGKNRVLAALQKEGFLPLHDGSTPQQIEERLGMSKKSFKKAVGGLYKAGKVELTAEGIRLTG
jgi:uncharacterized protein